MIAGIIIVILALLFVAITFIDKTEIGVNAPENLSSDIEKDIEELKEKQENRLFFDDWREDEGNLLPNPSFEDIIGHDISYWLGGDQDSVSTTSAAVHGVRAIQIMPENINSNRLSLDSIDWKPRFSDNERGCTLSAWVKSSTKQPIYLFAIGFNDAEGNSVQVSSTGEEGEQSYESDECRIITSENTLAVCEHNQYYAFIAEDLTFETWKHLEWNFVVPNGAEYLRNVFILAAPPTDGISTNEQEMSIKDVIIRYDAISLRCENEVIGEICHNGIDDDFDGLADCEDPDCVTVFENNCWDEIDNNCNGVIDCLDDSCEQQECNSNLGGCMCSEGQKTETLCRDYYDNDGDGLRNCEDPDCALTDDCFFCEDGPRPGEYNDNGDYCNEDGVLEIYPNYYIFLTENTYSGNLNGIEEADAICQAEAEAAELNGKYIAILSDSNVNIIDRIKDGNFYDVLDTLLANDKNRLFNSVYTGIDHYADGDQDSTENCYVWSGTDKSGKLVTSYGNNYACSDWKSSSSSVRGALGECGTTGNWIYKFGSKACNSDLHLYCVQISACGNTINEEGEDCDDGNVVSGDGCSADCKDERTCIGVYPAGRYFCSALSEPECDAVRSKSVCIWRGSGEEAGCYNDPSHGEDDTGYCEYLSNNYCEVFSTCELNIGGGII